MSIYIKPPSRASKSAKDLAEALGVKRIKRVGSKVKGSPEDILVNWGNPNYEESLENYGKVLNSPENVKEAISKLTCLQILEDNGVMVPSFTDSFNAAVRRNSMGIELVARTVLNGSGGAGIEVVPPNSNMDHLSECPLFVDYIKKKYEYRVHVFNGEVLVNKKVRVLDVPDEKVNWKIRNLEGGFIYSRHFDTPVPNKVVRNAKIAVNSLGLTFGAVDVIYNERHDRAYVLEVNTAPGIQGEVLDWYADNIRKYYQAYRLGMLNGN